jgi:hypothetical protein
MAGELSPDRLYYWDGVRWASAVSPDGAWRWDGRAWQATGTGFPRTAGSRGSIALVIAASLIVGILGVADVGSWAFGRVQNLLQSGGVNATCGDPHARAGASVSEGDLVCGKHLGMRYYSADCAELTGTPPGGQFLDSFNEGDWQTVDVVPSTSGCRLEAKPSHEIMFSTSDNQAASSTLIVDFVATGWQGGVGVQLACSRDISCVDFSFWGDSNFSLDEGKPGGGFENLTTGRMGSLGPPPVPAVGSQNRLILRVDGDRVDVFLNGREVTHATVRRAQSPGFADFYVDGRDTSSGETVFLKRIYLFETVSG